MTPVEIAEATLMSMRPIGADYLGIKPNPDGPTTGFMATMRELDGTERRGVGASHLYAVRALIYWYTRVEEYEALYEGPGGDG